MSDCKPSGNYERRERRTVQGKKYWTDWEAANCDDEYAEYIIDKPYMFDGDVQYRKMCPIRAAAKQQEEQ